MEEPMLYLPLRVSMCKMQPTTLFRARVLMFGESNTSLCKCCLFLKSADISVFAVQSNNAALANIMDFSWVTPVPVAERSKARVYGRSLAGIAGLNPAGGMDVSIVR